MIQIKENRGISLIFENGLTISVMIGTANYCARRDFNAPYRSEMSADTRMVESANAEIAIWNKDDKWLTFDNGDTVAGWIPTEEVGQWITKVQSAKDLAELQASIQRLYDREPDEKTGE